MFGLLKTFISNLVEDARPRNKFENEDCRLAAAALLIRVATVEREMAETRRGKLHAVLKSGFDLDDLTTVQLIDDAVAADCRVPFFSGDVRPKRLVFPIVSLRGYDLTAAIFARLSITAA